MNKIKSLLIFLLVVAIGLGLTVGVEYLEEKHRVPVWWELFLLIGSISFLILQTLIPKSFSYKKPIKVGLIVLLVLGVIAAVGSSRSQYKPRALDSDSKSNLHNLYLGCKAYWAEHGSEQECDVSKVATQEYGYVQSTRVSIYGKGPEATFTATAQHVDSTTRYTMDSEGNIR